MAWLTLQAFVMPLLSARAKRKRNGMQIMCAGKTRALWRWFRARPDKRSRHVSQSNSETGDNEQMPRPCPSVLPLSLVTRIKNSCLFFSLGSWWGKKSHSRQNYGRNRNKLSSESWLNPFQQGVRLLGVLHEPWKDGWHRFLRDAGQDGVIPSGEITHS